MRQYRGKRGMQRHIGCGARKFVPVSGASMMRFNIERFFAGTASGSASDEGHSLIGRRRR